MPAAKKNPATPQGRVCSRCGRVVRINDTYCPACGALLGGKAPYQAPAEPRAEAHTDSQAASSTAEPLEGQVVYDQTHSRVVAALLAFFLGYLGLHNFYLGNYTRAVCQLLLAILVGPLTCGLAFAAVYIWAFIEGALILSGATGFQTDAKGMPLRD